ncbi:HAD superfamily hydrolase (TIGR01509 family) [Thermosulfuriphilus ammonigenes]|nr:HAD-IA family hydrolase [Thermosulfuriphilus ammonigenes]MBA2848113.1 HAD superfamily hydrolase (TIGR01509 family) [Thermosulfuriphilus ammonigenes]
MLKLLIFDCDGVLFDSREANRAYYNRIREEFSLPPLDEDELQYVHMHAAEDSVRYIFRDHPHLLKEALSFQKRLDYAGFLPLLTPEPGLKELIEEVRPPLKTAISTNRSTTMPALREIFRLDELFDLIVCALDVERPKPHPEGVRKILAHFRTRPEEALYIGDTQVDEAVARAAGIPLVAYKNRDLSAAYHVSSFAELLPIIRGLLA